MSTQVIDTANLGAAADWIAKEYGGICEIRITSFNTNVGSQTPLVNPNADRVGLDISNIGSNDGILNPNNVGGIPGSGIDVGAGGGAVSMNVRDDFTKPTFGWSILTNAGTSIVFVIEVIRIVKTNPVQT